MTFFLWFLKAQEAASCSQRCVEIGRRECEDPGRSGVNSPVARDEAAQLTCNKSF